MLNYFYKIYQRHTVIRFLFIGGINTLFGYLVFSAATFLGAHYRWASLISVVAGVLFNFMTYGNCVFYNNELKLIFKFVAMYALVYALNVIGLSFLLSWPMTAYVAQAILTLPLAICAYVLNKRFVFQIGKERLG